MTAKEEPTEKTERQIKKLKLRDPFDFFLLTFHLSLSLSLSFHPPTRPSFDCAHISSGLCSFDKVYREKHADGSGRYGGHWPVAGEGLIAGKNGWTR